MSVLNNSLLLGAPAGGAAGYSISRSLRFNSADSAYLSRTPASAGNRKTWTWAGWVKRSSVAQQTLFFGGATDQTVLWFDGTAIEWTYYTSNYGARLTTTAAYRDFSAWMHVVFALDTTQSTANNRMRLYVNGAEVTVFAIRTNPSLNEDFGVGNNVAHAIGYNPVVNGYYFSGYLADIHFIDGQALTPTSFGEFSATTGVWVPKAFTGSYGTNGFHLEFADNSSNTATTLGKDTSGAGSNNWTPNNLSVTAGAGNDSLVDVPTNGSEVDTGLGGQVRGNYATLNPLAGSAGTLSNGNLDCSTSATISHRRSTFGVTSGKWYWECTPNSSADLLIGIVNSNATFTGGGGYPGGDANGWSYYQNNGNKYNNGGAAYGASYTTGDVVGVAFDADAGTLTFYKNGTSQGQAFSGLTSGPYFAAAGNGNTADRQYSTNFGQRPFAYTAPTGYKALCTTNLPAPTIVKPSTVMDTKLYTSNAGTNVISGLGFSPDLAWLKSRGTAVAHALYDTVRGAGYALSSNLTDAEKYTTDGFVSFNSDGFTLGANSSSPQPDINFTNAVARVAWCWDAGSSTVTNTAGSITSQVRANPSAGFSVITYTGTGTTASVGHGLGVAPSFIICKSRANALGWSVFHRSASSTGWLLLDSTAALNTATMWNPTPSSTTINFDANGFGYNNGASYTYVAYCFAPVAGYSSFGSYTGNGSADGPFVYLGFRPAVVLVKMSSSTGNWTILDDKREGYNVDNDPLYPNLSNAEGTTDLIDITSNGFKVRTTDATFNTSSGTYIYAAWASSPFAYSRAR